MWEIDASSNVAQPVQPIDRLKAESLLEDVLVKNPDILFPGLALVGRQTPTANGNLDLLGVDDEGRLVVFEIKRGILTRDAVAQAIDYCSYLDTLETSELATLITSHSGTAGIDGISDFEAWYGERHGEELISLRPTRMVLVGINADASAQRMVSFLTERGVDVKLLTFHGYQYGKGTLVAKQVEGNELPHLNTGRRRNQAERRRTHTQRANELDIGELWEDVIKALSVASDGYATRSGLTFYLPKITLPENVNVYGSHSVVIDEKGRQIRVTFFPSAIDLCWDRFQKLKEEIVFEFEHPPNAPSTKKVSQQWYCHLDTAKWKTYKPMLITLTTDMHAAWHRRRAEMKDAGM